MVGRSEMEYGKYHNPWDKQIMDRKNMNKRLRKGNFERIRTRDKRVGGIGIICIQLY